jgi:hypothetical protein
MFLVAREMRQHIKGVVEQRGWQVRVSKVRGAMLGIWGEGVCRCLFDGTSEEESSRGGEEVGVIGWRVLGMVIRDLSSFGTPAR